MTQPVHPHAEELQSEAVKKFWCGSFGVLLSVGVAIYGAAASASTFVLIGLLGLGLAGWTLREAVELNQEAESLSAELAPAPAPVQDYPDNWVDVERVADPQPDDVNQSSTRPRSGVAGTEGFD